jgi:hypothetical protein
LSARNGQLLIRDIPLSGPVIILTPGTSEKASTFEVCANLLPCWEKIACRGIMSHMQSLDKPLNDEKKGELAAVTAVF